MKITNEKIEINSNDSIPWNKVDNIRTNNDKLCLILSNGQVIEIDQVRPTTADAAFRAFESYLKDHPEKRKRIS